MCLNEVQFSKVKVLTDRPVVEVTYEVRDGKLWREGKFWEVVNLPKGHVQMKPVAARRSSLF